jgi:hypothetical protein
MPKPRLSQIGIVTATYSYLWMGTKILTKSANQFPLYSREAKTWHVEGEGDPELLACDATALRKLPNDYRKY